MIDKIENEGRKPGVEVTLIENLRKEFVRSKIEGKRTGIVAEGVKSTFYSQDLRRYDSRSRFEDRGRSRSKSRFDGFRDQRRKKLIVLRWLEEISRFWKIQKV